METDRDGLGQIGMDWDRLGWTGMDWDRRGWTGTDWDRLGAQRGKQQRGAGGRGAVRGGGGDVTGLLVRSTGDTVGDTSQSPHQHTGTTMAENSTAEAPPSPQRCPLKRGVLSDPQMLSPGTSESPGEDTGEGKGFR